MRAGSAIASIGRHVSGAVLEAFLLAALIAALLIALAPGYTPARWATTSTTRAATTTSWISLASVNGAAATV